MEGRRRCSLAVVRGSIALELARLVLVRGPTSRKKLVKDVKLSVASLGKSLIGTGLILEGGQLADERVGRPVRLLDVAPSSAEAGVAVTGVGVSLGRPADCRQALELAGSGSRAAAAVLDSAGKRLGKLIAAAANPAMDTTVVFGR